MNDMFKYNIDFYNKTIDSIANYYKYCGKMFENFMSAYNFPNRVTEPEGTFPANGHDIYNYVARYNTSNLQIQAILKLDGKVDLYKLKQAVKLSIETEPVFKCRFIEDTKPYWKPLDNIGVIKFLSLEETNDIDQSISNFIQSSFDIDNDPMLNIKLMRCESYDVIGFKINHACCDGLGALEYIQLLSDIYNKIEHDNRAYVPVPRIAGRKDQDRLFSELGITNQDSLFLPGSDISVPMWSFPWESCSSNIACISVLRFPHGYIDVINKCSKNKGVTVNDFILTAYYRAMLKMGQPIYGLPMEIPITVDLRRYLPNHKTQAIRNFSGSVSTRLTMSMNEPFNETLQRTAAVMKEIKQGYPGLQSALGLERIEKLKYQETLAYYQTWQETKNSQKYCPLYSGDKCVPTLSNLGCISKSLIKFGSQSVIDCYLLPPAIRAPGLLLMACTYNSVLTLAAGYYKGTVSKDNIDMLLNKVKEELIDGCEY
jgi:NRPS condensation-like uncharacterized protein